MFITFVGYLLLLLLFCNCFSVLNVWSLGCFGECGRECVSVVYRLADKYTEYAKTGDGMELESCGKPCGKCGKVIRL